ncbi:hypothetical protein CPS_0140 [Colwellia psychrerythraea 34H]|uniref:Uncharacterized protein n=1 Tax=Colwellia psychrerythraea (strain 34H / ATCC BAA-681) TaxID=167879 RepID=Q48AK5_COLP3|nr:hypothetical protein CPS_0140 [Colwellia psychrerythraea 34H]
MISVLHLKKRLNKSKFVKLGLINFYLRKSLNDLYKFLTNSQRCFHDRIEPTNASRRTARIKKR